MTVMLMHVAMLMQAARQARNLTHPLLCLDAIQFGVEHGGYAGLEKVRPLQIVTSPVRWASCCAAGAHRVALPILQCQTDTPPGPPSNGVLTVTLVTRRKVVIFCTLASAGAGVLCKGGVPGHAQGARPHLLRAAVHQEGAFRPQLPSNPSLARPI